jgi:hypothetical protein
MASIAAAQKASGYESPCSMRHGAVSAVWHGIRRTLGVAQEQKAPLLTADLRRVVDTLPDGLLGIRAIETSRDRRKTMKPAIAESSKKLRTI